MAVRFLTSSSPAQTEQLGAELASRLRPGDVVLIAGELGAGKTTLVRGACRALGIDGAVTSPTFTIGQRYRPNHVGANGVRFVAHVDLYRVADLDAEDPDVLADYLRPDAIAFVEWPPETEDPITSGGRVAARIRLEHAGGDTRSIEIDEA